MRKKALGRPQTPRGHPLDNVLGGSVARSAGAVREVEKHLFGLSKVRRERPLRGGACGPAANRRRPGDGWWSTATDAEPTKTPPLRKTGSRPRPWEGPRRGPLHEDPHGLRHLGVSVWLSPHACQRIRLQQLQTTAGELLGRRFVRVDGQNATTARPTVRLWINWEESPS